MTISTTTSRQSYNGNGVTTVFSVPFRFFANTDLVVQLVTVSTGASTTLTLTTHYTVTGADEEDGGSLTMLTAPAVGERLVIRRVISATQEVDYVAGDPFPAETHERALNRLTMLAQQGEEVNARALVFPAGDTASGELPAVATRASKLLGFNSSGELTVSAPASGSAAELALDLASTDSGKGAAMVGFIQSGTGAADRTALDKLRETVSVTDFGAVGDGIADDTAEIQLAIDHVAALGGGKVIARGNFLASGIAMKSNVTFDATGARFTKAAGAAGTHIVDFVGGVTATETAVSVDVGINADSVTVASTAGLAVGDWVMLYDATYKYSTFGRNQEINRIASIPGAVTLQNRTIGAYASASGAKLVKILPIENSHIVGGTFTIPAAGAGGNIFGELAVGCSVSKTTCVGMNDDPGICFEQSAAISIHHNRVKDGQNLTSGGYGYGVSIGESSHNCLVDSNIISNVRENLFTNNARLSSFTNNVVTGNTDNGVNTHGSGCENIRIANNTIISSKGAGITVGFSTHNAPDNNIDIVNNSVIGVGSTGIAVVSPSSGLLSSSNVSVRGNSVSGWGRISASQSGVLVSYCSDVVVSDNRIDGDSVSNANYGVWLIAATKVQVTINRIANMTANYGIGITSACDDISVIGNSFSNIASSNIREYGTASTNVRWINNVAESVFVTAGATTYRRFNLFGTKRDNDCGATSVANGGTIAHNCTASPTFVNVTGSIAGEIVTVTAKSSTTITVSILKHDGTAGTTQTVYWEVAV